MRSAGGLSPALSRPQGIGATYFAKIVKIFLLRYYHTCVRFVSILLMCYMIVETRWISAYDIHIIFSIPPYT